MSKSKKNIQSKSLTQIAWKRLKKNKLSLFGLYSRQQTKSKPIWKGQGSGSRDYRFGFPNNSFYFKSQNEMIELFKDQPQAMTCVTTSN